MPIRPYKSPDGRHGWQIDVSITRDGHTRRLREVVYRNRKWTEARERKLISEMQDEVLLGVAAGGALTFHALADEYLKHSKLTKKSYSDDVWRAEKLKKFFGAVPARAVQLDAAVRYQAKRAKETGTHGRLIAPATVNREMALLSAIYTFGIRTGRLNPPHNPCLYLKALPEPSVIEREISDNDLLRVCAGRSEHVRRLFLIARFTGLRRAAIIGLDWAQITNDGIIYPTQEQAASRKRVGRVPIREGLWAALGERPESGKGPVLTYHGRKIFGISNGFRAAQRDGGYFRIHDLRAAFHNELLRAGVDEIYRKVLMGHGRDLAFARSVQERYVRVTDADLIREIGKLPSCQTIVKAVLAMRTNVSKGNKNPVPR